MKKKAVKDDLIKMEQVFRTDVNKFFQTHYIQFESLTLSRACFIIKNVRPVEICSDL